MVIIGGLLFLFGLVDFIGSFVGFDAWSTLGVELPEVVWRFSPWIEMGLGAFLYKRGRVDDTEESDLAGEPVD
jgi:hypothetical protein